MNIPQNPNGQATMANSQPVVIASNQSAVPVSAASLPLPTGASTETTLSTRLSESDFDTKTGSLTETAPATDTASSGLNGRLQRIAQRISSLITALGSPFQAGGSIGNTSFGATQATASSLNATVVGTGTFAVQTTSDTPGTGATNLGKAEDAPHTTGDVGVMTLGVRNDSGVAIAGTDQDYIPHTMNSQGGMWVAPINFASTVNSSTALLAAGAVFTGTSESCVNFASLVVFVYSDQPSGVNGLSVQQSTDGTNWDVLDSYTIPAFNGKTYSFQPASSFYRIVYTNGPTAQTAFRLKTVLHSVYTKPSSQKAMDGYTTETDLEQQQAFNMLYDPSQVSWNMARGDIMNGAWTNVKQMPPGYSTDPLLEQLILLNTPTVNWTRQLDQSGREKIAPPSDTFTYNTTITASTAETTILPAIGAKTVLVGLVIANTSASTFTEITIRDSTGATDATSLQTFTSLGGAPHSGFMLGTQRIPQKVANNNWTAQCGTSTTSVKITVYYQIA